MSNITTPKTKKFIIISLFCSLLFLGACGGAKDLLDLVFDPPSRKPIDVSRMGVNNFFVDSQFGSTRQQFLEIRDILGLRSVRVLMAWTTAIQPSPNVAPNFSFFDEIIANIPPGLDVIIVVAHTPEWMSNPANWIAGNPRQTWVNLWLDPVVKRYGQSGGVLGFEVFNEPDLLAVSSDSVLELNNPDNYFELFSFAAPVVRANAPGRILLNAATSSINQNFPGILDYNKRLVDLGIIDLLDVFNIHFYGKQYERVIQKDGIRDFLNTIPRPIWITESGEAGPNNQLAYVEEVWPFLREQVAAIDRIYYYQFGETAPIDINLGLRTTDPAFPVSDLYVHLRDRS